MKVVGIIGIAFFVLFLCAAVIVENYYHLVVIFWAFMVVVAFWALAFIIVARVNYVKKKRANKSKYLIGLELHINRSPSEMRGFFITTTTYPN